MENVMVSFLEAHEKHSLIKKGILNELIKTNVSLPESRLFEVVRKGEIDQKMKDYFYDAIYESEYFSGLNFIDIIDISFYSYKEVKFADMDQKDFMNAFDEISKIASICPALYNSYYFCSYNDTSVTLHWSLPIPIDTAEMQKEEIDKIEEKLISYMEVYFDCKVEKCDKYYLNDHAVRGYEYFYNAYYFQKKYFELFGLRQKLILNEPQKLTRIK